VISRLLQGGGGPGSCPQAAGPLSNPAALAGLVAGPHPGRPGRGDGEPGLGSEREGDVPVPGDVLADLIVIEGGLVLGGLEALLDRPPGPGDPDQLR
jgi:hypothetical protein